MMTDAVAASLRSFHFKALSGAATVTDRLFAHHQPHDWFDSSPYKMKKGLKSFENSIKLFSIFTSFLFLIYYYFRVLSLYFCQ